MLNEISGKYYTKKLEDKQVRKLKILTYILIFFLILAEDKF